MARTPKPPVDPDDAPLRRLGGGRWQTRDERFTIEPQSGTWVVVDADQTDDFGMALVRGPFPSLTTAKDAISGARTSAAATSPLVERIERRRAAPAARTTRKPATAAPRTPAVTPTASKAHPAKAEPDLPREPGWLTDLDSATRGRARRLIERLVEDGVPDAEGLVRRDVVGDVPALAAHVVTRRLADLTADASPDEVATLLAHGRDERLGVRWRLVDGEGRPILVEPKRRRGG